MPKVSELPRQLGRAAFTGAVGVAAYTALRRVVRWVPKREVAVGGTVVGLRAWRGAERGAEAARLTAADIVAEAKARIGEQVAPPGGVEPGHDHDH